MYKRILIPFLLLCAFHLTQAQKPEPIYSFVKVRKSLPWYHAQAAAWKKEINKNKKNAFAWYNYYRVNRNLANLDTLDTRSREEKWVQLNRIVDDMGKAVPKSFEYNLCRYMTGGISPEFIPYLKKAEELGEGRTEHFSDMLVWAETTFDEAKKIKYARLWYESGQMSPGLLYYNYNVMASTEPNAIIITHGDNDTYPLWLLQSQGFRKDIHVLNASLLYLDDYRNKLFKELGIDAWDMIPKDIVLDKNGLATPEEYQTKVTGRYENGIVAHIARNKNKLPVYVAVTMGENFTKQIEDKLYLTGLTYQFSGDKLDNIALIKRNFEQNYALDYLDKHFYMDEGDYWVQCTNQNYAVPLAKLYEHYKLCNETEKVKRIKEFILKIVKNTDQEKEWDEYFKEN